MDRSDESHIEKAIHHLQQLLDVKSIDTFIVSFDTQDSSECIDKAWKDLETYHEKGVIQKLGLSDFDLLAMTDFLNKKNLKVKPSIDQVHVDQCCSLPQELIKLGKEHGIEITFNGDTTGTENQVDSKYYLSSFLFLNRNLDHRSIIFFIKQPWCC